MMTMICTGQTAQSQCPAASIVLYPPTHMTYRRHAVTATSAAGHTSTCPCVHSKIIRLNVRLPNGMAGIKKKKFLLLPSDVVENSANECGGNVGMRPNHRSSEIQRCYIHKSHPHLRRQIVTARALTPSPTTDIMIFSDKQQGKPPIEHPTVYFYAETSNTNTEREIEKKNK